MEEVVASNDVQEVLTPFYKRASEAEDRLARLEASLASQQGNVLQQSGSGNEELLKKVNELQSKLDEASVQREKALQEVQQLASENVKLQYRITHLVRALKEADSKIASS